LNLGATFFGIEARLLRKEKLLIPLLEEKALWEEFRFEDSAGLKKKNGICRSGNPPKAIKLGISFSTNREISSERNFAKLQLDEYQ